MYINQKTSQLLKITKTVFSLKSESEYFFTDWILKETKHPLLHQESTNLKFRSDSWHHSWQGGLLKWSSSHLTRMWQSPPAYSFSKKKVEFFLVSGGTNVFHPSEQVLIISTVEKICTLTHHHFYFQNVFNIRRHPPRFSRSQGSCFCWQKSGHHQSLQWQRKTCFLGTLTGAEPIRHMCQKIHPSTSLICCLGKDQLVNTHSSC